MTILPPIANNPDIRFLGAQLGDVIRRYGGDALFEATEAIRRASVDRYRGLGEDGSVDLQLEKLALDETLDFSVLELARWGILLDRGVQLLVQPVLMCVAG